MMNKHFELIHEMCRVFAQTENAIFFEDGGQKVAEINGATFSCNSIEEFYEMVEMFGEDDFAE